MKAMKSEAVEADCRQRGFPAKRLYAVFTTPNGDLNSILKHLQAHLDYQVQLEREGIMFAAGPLLTDDGEWCDGEGMIVIRAESVAQARAIAQADPMHASGARSFRLRPWVINEGSITVNLKLSTGRCEFP